MTIYDDNDDTDDDDDDIVMRIVIPKSPVYQRKRRMMTMMTISRVLSIWDTPRKMRGRAATAAAGRRES